VHSSTAALWLPQRALAVFFARLEREPEVPWSALRFHLAPDGIVLLDVLPRWTIFGVGVPLVRVRSDDRSGVFCERGVEPPPILRHFAPTAEAWLAVTRDGDVHLARLEPLSRAVVDLFTTDARTVPTEDASDAPPSAMARRPTDEALDPRADDAASRVAEWLVENERARVDDHELGDELVRAFPGAVPGVPKTARERANRPGWLRYLIDRTLPESTRRRLQEKGQRETATPDDRADVIRRQGKALSALLRKLAGPDWRDGLRMGLPLREPGEKERGARWLNPDPTLRARDIDFDIDALETKAAYGNVPVGTEIFRQFEGLYRRAAEQLVRTGELRRAAHVFSYLLGDHMRAGTVLEQAGFSRQAATVYYHLANRPRRAAVALTRAGLPAEAARIWMDLCEWRQAAKCWESARDASQANAAWRKVAIDLHDAGRLVESAEVRRDRLDERIAAVQILERCIRELDRHWRIALRRAVDDWIDLGDPHRARTLIELAIERCHDAITERPRRASFQSALELVDDIAQRAKSTRHRALVNVEAVRRAWTMVIDSWSSRRAEFAPLPRGELDRTMCAVAATVAATIDDPWLLDDVRRWSLIVPVDPPRRGNTATTSTHWLARRVVALTCNANHLILGDEEGRVVVLEDDLESPGDPAVSKSPRTLGELDTRTARPVAHVTGIGDEVYAAVDAEVFHFTLDAGAGSGAALQIERSLDGAVQDLTAFPDRTALLRLSTRKLHVLHPLHLQPIATVLEAVDRTLIAVACNHRYVAVLSRIDDDTVDEDPVRARHEVQVLYRPDRNATGRLREVERFIVDVDRAVRVEMTTRSGSELLIVGDELLIVVPARRDSVSYFELDIAARAERIQTAKVRTVRQGDVVLVAYADGSLERIDPRTRSRDYLAEAIGDGSDPLVGFAVRQRPTVGWLAHASGQVRRVVI